MFETILMLVLLGGAFALLIAIIVDGIVREVRDKRELKNHPQFFEDAKKLNELAVREMRYYNNNVAPLKNLIDNIVAEWDYYPEELKERKGPELELYRRRYQTEKEVCDKMNEEIDAERARLRKYAEENKIRWW
jgi:biopolymer transport protein ExbB/TolQ